MSINFQTIIFQTLLAYFFLLNKSSQTDSNLKIIVLPFKTLKPKNTIPSSPINVSFSIVSNPIYTNINTTTQNLLAIFSSGEYEFYMTSENCPEEANYYIKNSKTLMNISERYVSERMILYRDYELKTQQYGLFTKMRLNEYNNKKQCAIFGLQMNSKAYDYDSKLNFIKTFKSNENVNSSQWTFKYISDDEGLLIIGESPIIYDPMFKDKKYKVFQTKAAGQSDYVDFGIYFDDININGKSLEMKHIQFCHDLGVILVNKKIYEEIQNIFFTKYLDSNICKTGWVYDKYGYIQCDSNKFTDTDINSFPTIYFKKVDMEYIFELNSKDLFSKQNDGKTYFLIIFDLHFSNFKIGKLFLKKYPFTVDNEKNTISLFLLDQENNESDNTDTNGNTYIYIIILSITVAILVGVAVFLGYKLYLKKNKNKKRANELDEDYEYLGKEKNKETQDKNDETTVGSLGI